MDTIVSKEHLAVAEEMRKLWAVYEENRDLILLGAYKKGSDALIDRALEKRAGLLKFLIQQRNEHDTLQHTIERARSMLT